MQPAPAPPEMVHANKLAAYAGWVFSSQPQLLPSIVRDYLCELSAQLLVIPWGGGPLVGVEEAVRETRCTALVVEPGVTKTGLTTVYFKLIRCVGGELQRHTALRLWANQNDDLFLIPDPDGKDAHGSCCAVGRLGIEPAEMPWSGPFEHGFGLGHADALMLATKPLRWR
jgi:hypothetical protein